MGDGGHHYDGSPCSNYAGGAGVDCTFTFIGLRVSFEVRSLLVCFSFSATSYISYLLAGTLQ
jgi:hypothetical protein